MKKLLLIVSCTLAGCASTSTILEADAECYPYTVTKDEYRDCLSKKYAEFRQEVQDTKDLLINTVVTPK